MGRSYRRNTLLAVLAVAATAGAEPAVAAPDTLPEVAGDPADVPGVIVLELSDGRSLPGLDPGWDGRIFWDLRPPADAGGRTIRRIPARVSGTGVASFGAGASLALLPPEQIVAEGIVLLPAGPREVALLRQVVRGSRGTGLVYRFVARGGLTVAVLEGPPASAGARFVPDRAEILLADETPSPDSPDGITISYAAFHRALAAGRTGFVQYSSSGAVQPLASFHPGWTSVAAMIAPDPTGVAYQPDPGDPGSTVVLPEVWDFAGLQPAVLDWRTFNTLRDDTTSASCLESCALPDLGPDPADGTWQSWLKIDRFDPSGARSSRDVFLLNDNDTGADPSIDIPYVAFDELNVSDRTQICFDDSAGGADRFLRFFRFTGPDPGTAILGAGDAWTSGAWTSCNDASGLRLTLASVCGDACYPSCSTVSPRARGMLGSGDGFRSTIVEDGYVHVPAGNYLPALLMRQDTDLQAGVNFLGTCNLATVRNRFFDYFWLQERYGLLALVSSPTDETGTLPPDDWSSIGDMTDRVDVTWGPYPPHQMEAEACLAGTLVRWALPADGSNLGSAPGVSDWGYVVSWGADPDAENLADWTLNPNHTPLPGEAGYLAAPPGLEPTAAVIATWPGPAINATVVTALRYTDPDAGDVRTYRSAALYKVMEDPALLDPVAFVVGNGVAPFVTVAGDDLSLSWPAVAGASSYLLRVFDLDTRQEIPCPSGLDCSPPGPSAVHAGGAAAPANLAYRAFAVDACGGVSSN